MPCRAEVRREVDQALTAPAYSPGDEDATEYGEDDQVLLEDLTPAEVADRALWRSATRAWCLP